MRFLFQTTCPLPGWDISGNTLNAWLVDKQTDKRNCDLTVWMKRNNEKENLHVLYWHLRCTRKDLHVTLFVVSAFRDVNMALRVMLFCFRKFPENLEPDRTQTGDFKIPSPVLYPRTTVQALWVSCKHGLELIFSVQKHAGKDITVKLD